MTALKVTDLFPAKPPYKQRPLCEGVLTEYVTEVNRRRRKKGIQRFRGYRAHVPKRIPDYQCGNLARYMINGKCYCRKHGAYVALDLVAKELDQSK